jgi:heat-inducible transcriptional repressor
MPRLGERDEKILDFIVRDYIRSAFPVSSSRVSRGLRLEVSPATIRNAMLELDGEGYLEQPHTSAGRVPTDKAYRYFVDNLMEYRNPPRREKESIDEMARQISERHELLFETFGKIVSQHLKLFTALASFNGGRRVGGFGLEKILKEPEFENREFAVEFGKLVDNLESVARSFIRESSLRPKVFIGEENPLNEARDFSTVSVRFGDGEIGECVIFAVGPKRMDYERASSLLEFAVRDIVENL